MTPEEALKKMEEIAARGDDDMERNHVDADDILCELLSDLGHKELVKVYDSINKWYA